MDGGLIALVVAALLIAGILFLIIHLSPQASKIDKQKYQSRWLEIENSLNPSDSNSQQMAILNADKLLDQALRETGSKGDTMGERMKSREAAWSNSSAVWAAHKLRNQIAHDEYVDISSETVRRALASFKVALKDLGVM